MSQRKIKVVHLSTSRKGGAGIAAYRIHKALLKSQVDSHFICLDQDGVSDHISKLKVTSRNENESIFRKIRSKIQWRMKHHFNIQIVKKELLKIKLNDINPFLKCEITTLPFSDSNILEDPEIQKADIIHLHWVAGMLDYPSFFKYNTKPVIWTLHDMNPFQGIYHYWSDEENNKHLTSTLNAEILALKQKAVNKAKGNLSIVCPSKWLLEKAMKSATFRKVKGYCIPYPLDMQNFSFNTDDELKRTLKIPQQNTVILFVAQNILNYRKGFDLLIGALNKITNENISLLVVRNSDGFEIPGLDIKTLGTIDDEVILSKYYSLADVFIISSREDNLPNVMLESLACGTPVISFDVGGMAETIMDGFNGFKANHVNSEDLANTIKKFIKAKAKFNSQEILKYANDIFAEDKIAEQYKKVYKSVLADTA